MTVREKLKKMLTDCGMFDNQADKVLEEAIPAMESMGEAFTLTWDSPSEHYPDSMYSIIRIPLYKETLKWIDKNAPEAWFRDIFKR